MQISNEALRRRISRSYRQISGKILIYLKANPEVLNSNNNKEVFRAVREIQIKHTIKNNQPITREEAEDISDFLSDLEARKYGKDYFFEQEVMDLYRPSTEHNDDWINKIIKISLYFTLNDNAFRKEDLKK